MTQPGLATWVASRQIGHLDQCAIGSGLGFRAIEVAGIDAQKDYLAFLRQRCELDTALSQPLHVDLSVDHRLRDILAHVRSNNGESDNSGKLRAPAQLPNASTRLNRASLAFPKHR
jgi:hypothetical protein